MYKDNEVMEQDEKFSPLLEDIVLLDVLREINPRLPNAVKTFYFHKIKNDERLMDFKTDILLHIPHLLDQLENREEGAVLHAMKQFQPYRKKAFIYINSRQRKYCRMCHLSNKKKRYLYIS